MDFSGSHFEYSGVSSRLYRLVFANVETEIDNRLMGTISSNTLFNRRHKTFGIINDSYDESQLVIEAEVVTDDDEPISKADQRNIERWLFGHKSYRKLYFDVDCLDVAESVSIDDGYIRDYYLNCRFVSPVRIEDGSGVRGYRFDIECDSCMLWCSPTEVTIPVSNSYNGSSVVKVLVDTDIGDYTYPKVEISIGGAGGDISISNLSDSPSRITAFSGMSPYSKIIMNGNINYLSEQNFMNFSKRNFVRLVDGENSLSVKGDIQNIKLIWNNRRYF